MLVCLHHKDHVADSNIIEEAQLLAEDKAMWYTEANFEDMEEKITEPVDNILAWQHRIWSM